MQDFNLPSLSLTFFAVRDIKKGEQIFYSYTDIYQPAVVRQQKLSKYGFRCTCKACSGDTSEEIEKFRAIYREAMNKLFAYQQKFLRNPLLTEKALEPVYRFKAAAIKAGVIHVGNFRTQLSRVVTCCNGLVGRQRQGTVVPRGNILLMNYNGGNMC